MLNFFKNRWNKLTNNPKRYIKDPYEGDVIYYVNEKGQLHMEEKDENGNRLPAYISFDLLQWFHNGLLHNENAPAFIKYAKQSWYNHGQRHRLTGPAIFNDYIVIWYTCWAIKDKVYYRFNHVKFLKLKITIKIFYFICKNKQIFNPKNLGGRFTKRQIYSLFVKLEN
jgi:hypothetical protein